MIKIMVQISGRRTDLPFLIEGLKVEVACPVLVRLTHICIQKRLEVGNRCSRWAVTLVTRVRRILSRMLSDWRELIMINGLYRWPTSLCNVHRRVVAHICRSCDIGLLEKLIGPPCGLID